MKGPGESAVAQGQDRPHFRIELTPAALRDLKALPKNVLRRVDRRVLGLADNQRPRGSEKLKGETDLRRVRVGDYRIVYKIDERALLVIVVRIGHRREVYHGLP